MRETAGPEPRSVAFLVLHTLKINLSPVGGYLARPARGQQVEYRGGGGRVALFRRGVRCLEFLVRRGKKKNFLKEKVL